MARLCAVCDTTGVASPKASCACRDQSIRLTRRRRTTEVAQWALADVDLKPFIYVYELPPEHNIAFKALPAGWHSEHLGPVMPCALQ